MKDLENLKTIAVLIDAENAQYGAIGAILDELSKHGNVLAKSAYGDWSSERLKKWPDVLDRLAIRPHHQFARTSGKNAIDIAMVIDAMDIFHSEKFDAFALVSSDSDFAGLASRLRRGGKYVFGFGEEKTPISFRNACDDFIVTSLLVEQPPTVSLPKTEANSAALEDINIVELLKSAASEYGDAEGWTLASHAGSMIKRQRPDFQPKSFGCKSLLQLVGKFGHHFELRKVPRGEGMVDEYRERRDA
jgi:NYN domain-containing protein/OST-HTH/LOTUS domain-containing protein